MWTDAAARGFGLADVSRWMSAAPAKLAGLSTEVGSIEAGKHANFVAFDADASFTVTPEVLHYRHRISPYMGETLRGVVRGTWLRGQKIFDGDVFPVTPQGREYAVSCALHQR